MSEGRLGLPFPGHPLLGALPDMQRDPVGVLARAAFEVGPVVDLRLPHPKNSMVVFSAYVLHRLPDVWPNPEGFDPQRFADCEPGPLSAPKGTPRGAYIPFSLGPRKCIGDTFALLEAQLVLATLLPRVSLALVPGAKVGVEGTITLRPRKLKMHVTAPLPSGPGAG